MTSHRCSSSSLTHVASENVIPAGHVLVDIAEDESLGYITSNVQELSVSGDGVTIKDQLVHLSADGVRSAFTVSKPMPRPQSQYFMAGNDNIGCANVHGNIDERLPITDALCPVTRPTTEPSTSGFIGSNSTYSASNRRRSSVTFSVPDNEQSPTWQGRVHCSDQSSNEASYLPSVETPSAQTVDKPHRSTLTGTGAPYRQHAVDFSQHHSRLNASTAAEKSRSASQSDGDDPYSTALRKSSGAPSPSKSTSRRTSAAEHGGHLRSVERSMSYDNTRPSIVSLAPGTRQHGADSQRRQSILVRIHNNKAVRMTFIVVGAFLVCWVPVSVTHFVRVMNGSLVSNITWDAVVLVSLSASLINPLVYNFYSAEFRRAAARFLTCNRYMYGSPFF